MTPTTQHEGRLSRLQAGMVVPYGGDRYTTIGADLAAAFTDGDRLYVAQDSGALLHVPSQVHELVTATVDAAVGAAAELRAASPAQVSEFFRAFARNLDGAWPAVVLANEADVARARGMGRSTTRLEVSTRMREDMSAGLHAWAGVVDDGEQLGTDHLDRIDHGTWTIDVVTAPLGVIGFVFEGRPNVFADAAGVLATGNAAVLRIGGDALDTAQAILDHALRPALREAALPEGVISLIGSRERSAGWALFSDARLSLAVVRGSGAAVTQLSGVAAQAGIPVSAHGTGGAWLVADATADAERFAAVVVSSLDRKVCNTLNVAVIIKDRAADLVPRLLDAADQAASQRGAVSRVHVAEGSESWFPADEWGRSISVGRAEGAVIEPRLSTLPVEELGTEWEWEGTPELSVVVVEDIAEAIRLFDAHSPQFVASLITNDQGTQERFRAEINAPFVGDGFTRWVDGQYALNETELGLSNWQRGRLIGRSGVLTGADLTTRRLFAHHEDPHQHR